MGEVDNSQDVLASRDVIARIEELESDESVIVKLYNCEYDDDEVHELIVLRKLAEEAEGCSDWEHGETLVRDSYFEDYAQELASGIGAINRDADWLLNCIDWAKAAEQLQQDYTSVDYDGVTYWIRS